MPVEVYYFWSLIISTIAVVLTALGLVFACVQLWQLKNNRVRQFDQARRERTIESVLRYINDTDYSTRAVEKIVSQFSDEQCRDLYNFVPVEIDDKARKRLCGICPYREKCMDKSEPCKGEDGKYYIKDDILYFVRGNIINYLNSLECVLLAWQLGIVDQDALEEQFAFLDKKGTKDRAASAFRTVAGEGGAYPAIEKFYQHLDQKKAEEAQKSLREILK